MRPPFSFPQIATGDLNIAAVGQLSSTNLPFGDQFEPRPIKVVRFEAAFGRRSLWKQVLENAPGHAHHTLIFADAYTELDDGSLGVPANIGRKAKEHGPRETVPRMFYQWGYERQTPFVEAARRQPRRSAKLALAEAGGE